MPRHSDGFSLIEVITVLAVFAILAVVAAPTYRAYTIRASIGALISTADKVKNEVEDAHNQGTVFGTSGDQTYVASNATDKPTGLIDLVRTSYGCVNIDIDTGQIGLDSNHPLTMVWCPYKNQDSIDWQCGYTASSFAQYIQYLPANCQQSAVTIQDTSF